MRITLSSFFDWSFLGIYEPKPLNKTSSVDVCQAAPAEELSLLGFGCTTTAGRASDHILRSEVWTKLRSGFRYPSRSIDSNSRFRSSARISTWIYSLVQKRR